MKSAHAIYTDVWASMGQESEATATLENCFGSYQVNVAPARESSEKTHCSCTVYRLSAGLEVTDEVMESAQCVAFDQAENRLHVQKALLLTLLR